VDACHGAVGAGDPPAEVPLGQRLGRDRLGALELARLQVPRGQAAGRVKGQHVDGRAQVVVLLHERRIHRRVVDGVVSVAVGLAVGDVERAAAAHHQRLELFGAEHGAQAQAAEMAVGLGDDAGVAHAPLAGAADAHDGAGAGAGLAGADHRAHGGGAAHAPQRRGVAEADAVPVHRQVDRRGAGAADHQRAVAGGTDGHGAAAAGVALAQVAGERRLEHGHRLGRQREEAHERAHRHDDGVVRPHRISAGRTLFFQKTDGGPGAAEAVAEDVGPLPDLEAPPGQVDVQHAVEGGVSVQRAPPVPCPRAQ